MVKDLFASDATDQPLEQMVEQIVGTMKRDIGKLKLEPYLRIDDTKPIDQALAEEDEEMRKAQAGQMAVDESAKKDAKTRRDALKKFLTKELGLKRVFYLSSPRWVVHALIVAAMGAVQLIVGIIATVAVVALGVPELEQLTRMITEEGANDLKFAIEAFLKGDCPHVKRWFKDVKLPSVCQTVFNGLMELGGGGGGEGGAGSGRAASHPHSLLTYGGARRQHGLVAFAHLQTVITGRFPPLAVSRL